MQKHYFVSHYDDAEVTDKKIIAMLEKDKPPEPDAAINRPVTDKRIIAMLKKEGRLERTVSGPVVKGKKERPSRR